jgi:hypothetical protein
MFLTPYYLGFSFIEVQGPQQEVQGPPVNRKYVQGPQNMGPLHTSEALAPLLVALAHVQVALAHVQVALAHVQVALAPLFIH